MKIWSLEEDVNFYEHITLIDGSDDEWDNFSSLFNGMPVSKGYKPLRVCVIENGGKLKRGDMPYLSPGKPVFTKKALDALKTLLSPKVEILPIFCEGQELVILNVINQLDAIDLQKSDIKFMPDGKRIMRVKKFVFRPEVVSNQHIFKIRNQLYGTVFVSDEFRNRVLESGLEGIKFVKVWDSNE